MPPLGPRRLTSVTESLMILIWRQTAAGGGEFAHCNLSTDAEFIVLATSSTYFTWEADHYSWVLTEAHTLNWMEKCNLSRKQGD